MKIITTTKLQQKIGEISADIGENPYIVTNRGEAKVVLLPYFDQCDELIDNYMEDYEISLNRDELQKEWKKSSESGESDLVI